MFVHVESVFVYIGVSPDKRDNAAACLLFFFNKGFF